ncbi:MAG: hypothetical protein ABI466_07475 [Chloroflexota bacterium]
MNPPRLRIEPLGAAKPDGEQWRTTWRVANLEPDPVRIVGVVAPHSQFRGETAIDREIRGKGSTQVSLVVRVAGATASEIENAFVILTIEQGDQRWRALARLRIALEDQGTPRLRVETVTMQRVGFSGEL